MTSISNGGTSDKSQMSALSRRSSAILRHSHSTMVNAHTWDIFSPPPTTSLKGSVVPHVLTRYSRRRRVSVEIHELQASDEGEGYEECIVRVLVPNAAERKLSKQRGRAARRQTGVDKAFVENDSVIGQGEYDDDDGSTESLAFADKDEIPDLESYQGWKAKYKMPLSAIEIKSVKKRDVIVSCNYRNTVQVRDLIFDTPMEARAFVDMINTHQQLEQRRQARKLQHSLGGIKLSPGEVVTLLIEIVSGIDLPAGDLNSSDPYVVCYVLGKQVHRTDYISKTLEPVWTLKTGSLFILSLPSKELFQSEGLHCEVWDYDVGKDEKLGSCDVPPKTLYEAAGERLVFQLENKELKGSLAIRCRHATSHDKKFMKEHSESQHKKGGTSLSAVAAKAGETSGERSTLQSVVARNKKQERNPKTGQQTTLYRVRPRPDPRRKTETDWMTKEQIDREILNESREWIDTGSGMLGRVFVEILGCDDLPNLDTGGFLGNKTDAFVGLVFEDSWAQTDVIADTLRPRWLPWTKRAFIFHMYHPSSDLFLSAFDYDTGIDSHDLIGRVAINLSNLRSNTMYTLAYDLYPTARLSERKPNGTITIRLRIELDDCRKLLTTCLEPPITQYVNVKKRKDFKVLKMTCIGLHDVHKYNTKIITAYVDELSSYQTAMIYVEDALIAVLLWRPQSEVTLFGTKYMVPLHSMVVFLSGILMVERPQLIPSFVFASISWIMVAVMLFRTENPNPWKRCKTLFEILTELLTGVPGAPPDAIKKLQNTREVLEFEERWKERVEKAQKKADEAAKQAKAEAELAEQELEAVGGVETDLSAKTGGLSLDLLRLILEPLQGYLAVLCQALRFVRNIVLWEECYMSFWVTIGSSMLSIVCLFVPWFFLIKWISRILVWGLLGPWMTFVDIYYYRLIENMSEEEIQRQKEEALRARRLRTEETIVNARIAKEKAAKLKEMKRYLFGKFIMKVPVLKEDRWRDYPLAQSTAVPYNPKPLAFAELAMKEAGYHRTRIPGQNLKGDMIPTVESSFFTDAPVGQATKKHANKESDTGAYAVVGSLVAGAAVITWFGVPVISSIAGGLLGAS